MLKPLVDSAARRGTQRCFHFLPNLPETHVSPYRGYATMKRMSLDISVYPLGA